MNAGGRRRGKRRLVPFDQHQGTNRLLTPPEPFRHAGPASVPVPFRAKWGPGVSEGSWRVSRLECRRKRRSVPFGRGKGQRVFSPSRLRAASGHVGDRESRRNLARLRARDAWRRALEADEPTPPGPRRAVSRARGAVDRARQHAHGPSWRHVAAARDGWSPLCPEGDRASFSTTFEPGNEAPPGRASRSPQAQERGPRVSMQRRPRTLREGPKRRPVRPPQGRGD